ncbi:MAG: ribonuclease D [Candidatus Poriferisodalaceae bacterium]
MSRTRRLQPSSGSSKSSGFSRTSSSSSTSEPSKPSEPSASSQATDGYTWLERQADFDGLVARLVSADRIAIDTEFHREKTYWPQLALIQIRVEDDIFLVDPTLVDIASLAAALHGPVVVMHAASQDLEVLERSCGTIPLRIFDTQVAAGFVGMSTPSLSTLVEKFLGVQLPKGDRLTDWFERPLREAQRTYAASDVAYLFEIHDLLMADLANRDRVEWAEDEIELTRVPNKPSVPPALAWTRIKEARHLRGKARAIASVLAEWRELTAQRTDVPARFVLSDLGLVGIAQRAPDNADALRKIRGVDGRFMKDGAAARIVEMVAQGAAMSPDDVPTLPSDKGPAMDQSLRPATTLVSAWLAQLAKDAAIDPGLLATRSDITDVLRNAPEARLATGWRRDLAGAAITDLVEGRAALAFEPGGALVLESRAH